MDIFRCYYSFYYRILQSTIESPVLFWIPNSPGAFKMKSGRWTFITVVQILLRTPIWKRLCSSPSSTSHSSFLLVCTMGGTRWWLKYWAPDIHVVDRDWVPGFGLAQSQLLWAFGEWPSGWKVFAHLSPTHLLFK